MIDILAPLRSVENFMDAGGSVMWIILLMSIVLWSMIIERVIFFKVVYPQLKQKWLDQWHLRSDKHSPFSLYFRQGIISEAKLLMRRTLPIIRSLVILSPMLGLLGTVLGMINMFDVMAITGTGNARAMASGVSQATLTTMAGMVIAISGMYFAKLIEGWVEREVRHLTDSLQF
ncbi:MAG: MotA/TolQ/ExbB proton channel family protein [Methylococcaceae bacterium]